jgi:hypothetical protein
MADISISPLAPREFRVQVREGNRETTHQVTVPERLGEGLELRDDDLERVVRESFRFLLERERATSILAQFSLSDISRYSPSTQTNSHAASAEPARSPPRTSAHAMSVSAARRRGQTLGPSASRTWVAWPSALTLCQARST